MENFLVIGLALSTAFFLVLYFIKKDIVFIWCELLSLGLLQIINGIDRYAKDKSLFSILCGLVILLSGLARLVFDKKKKQ